MESLLPHLRDNDRFLLVTHMGPDGDAIGSQIALGTFLEKLGKQVTMLNHDSPPRPLEWLPGVDDVEVFDETSFDHRRSIAEAEVVVVLDTNAEERLGNMGEPVRQSGAVKLLIDHHTNPETWFDETYVRDTSAATGELIYEIINEMKPELIDEKIATALYTAIMTDTGSFRYSSVTPQTHRIIADILERGDISPDPIHTAIFDNRTFASLRLLSRALSGIRLRYGGKVGYTTVTNEMFEATGADSDDKKGIVSYVLSIEGVEVALIFSEAAGGTKISFRSQGDMHVNEWASEFGGGGHRNASGAYVDEPITEAVEHVLEAAPRFLDLDDSASGDPENLSSEDASYLATMLDLKS